MKGPQVDQRVFECMFPKPKAGEVRNFQQLLQQHLVPEVRLETQAFYGHLSSQEAKYPGLDYSHKPHRVRLSRYQWHRRLFRAFDNLNLTKSEIAGLTKWEGTRWAKERYEREQGIVIRDTTSDGIEDWVPPDLRIPLAPPQAQRADIEDMEDIQEDEDTEEIEQETTEMDQDEDSEAEMRSIGIELNMRLRAAVAAREAGHPAPIDEEWEQWLKDAVENGGLPYPATDLSPTANIPGTRPATDSPAMHPRLLNAARSGQWQQIPEPLHSMLYQNIEERHRRSNTSPASASPSPLRTSTTVSATTSNVTTPSSPSSSSPFTSDILLDTRADHRPSMATAYRAALRENSTRPETQSVLRLDTHLQNVAFRRPTPPRPASSLSSPSRSRLSTRLDRPE